jgi:zinc transport system substrate-binding protein
MRAAILLFTLLHGVTGFLHAREPIVVSASIPPLAAIARDVGGKLVDVQVILPPGASPHGFAPTPEAVRLLAKAEVHLVIGRGLDLWAETLARGANPRAALERVAEGDLPGPEPSASAHDSDHDAGAALDPHVWLDPLKAAAIADRIGEILIRTRPDQADAFRRGARLTRKRYERLDRLCEERLAPVREVAFVSQHGALHHFTARYRLHQVGVIELFPGYEPSPRYLKGIIERIRTSGARVVFSEPQSSARLAEVVGRETGIRVAEIDPLGGTPGRETYAELMESCLDVVVRALGDQEEAP